MNEQRGIIDGKVSAAPRCGSAFFRCSRTKTLHPKFLRDDFAYYRIGFHPWQLDNIRLPVTFERELATSEYYAAAR